jgi:hypothetical protein
MCSSIFPFPVSNRKLKDKDYSIGVFEADFECSVGGRRVLESIGDIAWCKRS